MRESKAVLGCRLGFEFLQFLDSDVDMAGQAAEEKSAAAASGVNWVEGGSCAGWEEEGRLLSRLLEDCEQQQQEVEEDQEERFTGHSCLLITWKTNPEIEKFKVVRRLFEQIWDLCLTR